MSSISSCVTKAEREMSEGVRTVSWLPQASLAHATAATTTTTTTMKITTTTTTTSTSTTTKAVRPVSNSYIENFEIVG